MEDRNDPIQNSPDPIPQAPPSDDHWASHDHGSEIDDREHFDHELGFSLSELLIQSLSTQSSACVWSLERRPARWAVPENVLS